MSRDFFFQLSKGILFFFLGGGGSLLFAASFLFPFCTFVKALPYSQVHFNFFIFYIFNRFLSVSISDLCLRCLTSVFHRLIPRHSFLSFFPIPHADLIHFFQASCFYFLLSLLLSFNLSFFFHFIISLLFHLVFPPPPLLSNFAKSNFASFIYLISGLLSFLRRRLISLKFDSVSLD